MLRMDIHGMYDGCRGFARRRFRKWRDLGVERVEIEKDNGGY